MKFPTFMTVMSVLVLAQPVLAQEALQDGFDFEIPKVMPQRLAPTIEELPKPPSGDIAILRAVDKITARVTDIQAPLNGVAKFETLQITMRYCYKNPPEDTPEVTAFLEVVDHQPDSEPETSFIGWMFASSPALSAMEHPVYDVWVIDCKATVPEISEGNTPNLP